MEKSDGVLNETTDQLERLLLEDSRKGGRRRANSAPGPASQVFENIATQQTVTRNRSRTVPNTPHQVISHTNDFGRTYFGFFNNQTANRRESVDLATLSKHADSAKETKTNFKRPSPRFRVDEQHLSNLKEEKTQILLHEDAIKDHVGRRIQLFYFQLVACAGSGLVFGYCDKAVHQDDQAPPFQVIVLKEGGKPKLETVGSRHAAHSSTHPALTLKVEGAPGGELYLFGTDFYRAQQTTITVPRFVNLSADQTIDKQLRPKALALLNKASKNNITPEEALKAFVRLFLTCTAEYKGKKGKKPELAKLVANYYKAAAEKWETRLKEEEGWFATILCGFAVTGKNQRDAIWKVAQTTVQLRLRITCTFGGTIQAFISDKLSNLLKEENFHPNFCDFLVKLCRKAKLNDLSRVLARYYSYSGDLKNVYKYKRFAEKGKWGTLVVNEGRVPRIPIYNQQLQDALEEVDYAPLMKELQQQITRMLNQEAMHRCHVFRQLMAIYEIQIDAMDSELNLDTDQDQMARIIRSDEDEKRLQAIDSDFIGNVSECLGIKPTLFYLFFEEDIKLDGQD